MNHLKLHFTLAVNVVTAREILVPACTDLVHVMMKRDVYKSSASNQLVIIIVTRMPNTKKIFFSPFSVTIKVNVIYFEMVNAVMILSEPLFSFSFLSASVRVQQLLYLPCIMHKQSCAKRTAVKTPSL